jgi:hypothetical protein
LTVTVTFATNGLLITNADYFYGSAMIFAQKSRFLFSSFYIKLSVLLAIIFSLGIAHSAISAKEGKHIEDKPPMKAEKAVLDPEKFFGQIAAGYKAAQQAKDVCSKLFCYCGCDLTDEHVSLLDCFTGMHGVDCAICQEEAIIALNMKKQGKTLAQTQKVIDEKFSSQYPWDEPSPTLQRYLQSIKANSNKLRTTYNTNTSASAKKRQKRGHCCGH